MLAAPKFLTWGSFLFQKLKPKKKIKTTKTTKKRLTRHFNKGQNSFVSFKPQRFNRSKASNKALNSLNYTFYAETYTFVCQFFTTTAFYQAL
ncbi:MAG: hypothetical protein CMF60_02595 [Magnetococcales bacterium]|nr:hypothetical protein [Magnetococcales bacterium]